MLVFAFGENRSFHFCTYYLFIHTYLFTLSLPSLHIQNVGSNASIASSIDNSGSQTLIW